MLLVRPVNCIFHISTTPPAFHHLPRGKSVPSNTNKNTSKSLILPPSTSPPSPPPYFKELKIDRGGGPLRQRVFPKVRFHRWTRWTTSKGNRTCFGASSALTGALEPGGRWWGVTARPKAASESPCSGRKTLDTAHEAAQRLRRLLQLTST